ncbi:MAG: hypothetical protein ACRCV6_05485 [Formosimonas sp.]
MPLITDSFEDLAQALRVLLEADRRANHDGLLQIDRAEAVGNIETALASTLNAFHSLYDALDKVGQSNLIDWYNTPELATVLVLRNARHHNQAKKIRTMYSYYAQEAKKVGHMEMYVLVDFPSGDADGDTFDVYLSWADLSSLLNLPQTESRIRPSIAQAIRDYLGTDKYRHYAEHFQQEEDQVFFNVVPLLVNAATKVVPKIKTMVSPRSTESEIFISLFEDLSPADTKNPDVNCGPIAYPL